MNLQRSLCRTTTALLSVIAIQGCAASGDHVAGRVIDVDTGKPVPGAYVYARSGYYKCGPFELGGCGCINVDAALTRTDKSGYYEFDKKFDFGGSFFSDRFGTVIAYKRSYASSKSNYPSIKNTYYDKRSFYSEFFYGSGRYSDEYEESSINSNSGIYKITKRPIKPYSKKHDYTPRLVYLVNIITDSGPPACVSWASKKTERVFRKFQNILIRDAKNLINTARACCRFSLSH